MKKAKKKLSVRKKQALPQRKRTGPNLKELLSRVTPENSPPTYDWGPDVGTEIINAWEP